LRAAASVSTITTRPPSGDGAGKGASELMTQPSLAGRLQPGVWLLIGLAALYAALFRLATDHHPWLANFAMVGALALFAGARLGLPWACLVTLAVMAVSDALLYWWRNFEEIYRPSYLSGVPLGYLSFLVYVLLGRALWHTESPWRIGGLALAGSVQFFLITNFGAWLSQALPYGYTLQGLLNCYIAGLPFFFRGTLVSDLFFTGVLFGAHALLSHTVFPAERVARPQEAAA
jgi:hypothetical protein